MFIFWSLSSISFFFMSLLVFFFFRNTFFFTWVGLELITWAIFFFFSLYWNKNSQEILFMFFFIQRLRSILWLIRSFLKENIVVFYEDFFHLRCNLYWSSISITEILIIGSMFLKIGLFSGHVWIWQLYSIKITSPVVLISTFQKIYPIIIIVWLFQEYKNSYSSFFYFLILLSILIVSTKRWKGFRVFFFLFLSRILQYRILLLCRFVSFFEIGGIFILSYWFLFVLTIFLLKEFKLERAIRGQGGNSFIFKRKREILFISLSLRGFPPTIGFFMKFFLLIKVRFFTISILGLILLIRIFLYISFVVFTITKILIQFKSLRGSEFFLQEKNKNKNQEGFFFYSFWFYLRNFFILLLN